MRQQQAWEPQQALSLPELFLEDPRLSETDEELLNLYSLDASESLLGSAETSQGGVARTESGSLSEQGLRPTIAGAELFQGFFSGWVLTKAFCS